MTEIDPAAYGDAVADLYDELIDGHLGDIAPVVAQLADLAKGGRALELGIGTGRIAIPLHSRGIEVHGIDASPAMAQKLRSSAPHASLNVITGDFADVSAEGLFRLIYVVFNTFSMLPTHDAQLLCFANVAKHLEPGGAFLIEAMLPDESLYDRGQRLHVHDVSPGRVWLEASRYNSTSRQVSCQNILITSEGIHLHPAVLLFSTTAELDLMARQAGLALDQRWSGWEQQPFNARGGVHISVYRKI